MKRLLLALLIAVPALGQDVTLTLYRQKKMSENMYEPTVYLDGKAVVNRWIRATYVQLSVPPGKHSISISEVTVRPLVPVPTLNVATAKPDDVGLEVEATREALYVEMTVDKHKSTWTWKYTGNLALVPKDIAEHDIRNWKLKPLPDKFKEQPP